jgi:hypothetical protein
MFYPKACFLCVMWWELGCTKWGTRVTHAFGHVWPMPLDPCDPCLWTCVTHAFVLSCINLSY